jgi:hypothetical protein
MYVCVRERKREKVGGGERREGGGGEMGRERGQRGRSHR